MTRSYSPRAVALAVGTKLKWVDNLLSHHELPGVSRGRRGIERKIDQRGVLAVALVRMLTGELGIPAKAAVSIIAAAIESRDRDRGRFASPSGVTLLFPLDEIERHLRGRLVDAMEAVGQVPRGRPPRPVKRETPS
jgi:O-acetyl-ADP-ribose deacetylase (regulator of RNase III)